MKRYLFHMLTFFFVLIFLAQGLSSERREKINLKEIGLWLKNNGYQGSVMMGTNRFLRLVFYADGKFLEMPNAWEKVTDSINRSGVRIIVIDSCNIEQDCPGFLANLNHARLFLIQRHKEKKGKCEIQIYGVSK